MTVTSTRSIGGSAKEEGSRAPLVSVCIPTYDNADVLDLCLERLADLNRLNIDYEVVVSDDGSPDHTTDVVEARRALFPRLTFLRMKRNRGAFPNWLNTIRHARGQLLAYLAHDDRLITENFAAHLETMVQRPELVATFTDFVAYDDSNDCELHRYMPFLTARREFVPAQRFELLEFLFANPVLPEIGIMRRAPFLRALPITKNGYPYLQYAYLMLRQGTIAFDPLPYYLDNRIYKPHLRRRHVPVSGPWLVGDEMRNTLDALTLMAYQDSGRATIPDHEKPRARELVFQRLNQRVPLEAAVLAHQGKWIEAVELKRRAVLWSDPRDLPSLQVEIDQFVVPAALQAIKETFDGTTGCERCAFHGFVTEALVSAFRATYPDVPVEESPAHAREALHRGDRSYLHVAKVPAHAEGHEDDGNVLCFAHLVDLYKTVSFNLSLEQF